MGAVEIICTTVAGLITLVAVVLAARAVLRMVSVIRAGQPDPGRLGAWPTRGRVMLTEIFGHTRMLKWSVVGAAHWFVMIAFIVLFLLVLEAYFEVVDPEGGLPIIGHWVVYGLVTEIIGVLGFLGILTLITIRLRNRPGKARGLSRFTGSTMWQGYFVEWIIFAVLVCGFLIRGFKVANDHFEFPRWATPVSHWVGDVLPAWEAGPTVVATVKIVVSMTWLIVIALNVTMGVAWHRFLAFPNIFFKRDPAKPAGSGLGGLRPMMSGGKPLDFEEADPEKDQFGVAQVEQFTWKGLLDFTHLHGVRPLPVAVPGVEHRQAAVAQAARAEPARPRVRQGALPAGRRRQGPGRRGEGHRGAARARGRPRDGRGGAPAHRRRRGRWGHRPRRALVLHDLRRLRGAVPGGHRARRPHRRHAPLPGAHRVDRSRPRPASC